MSEQLNNEPTIAETINVNASIQPFRLPRSDLNLFDEQLSTIVDGEIQARGLNLETMNDADIENLGADLEMKMMRKPNNLRDIPEPTIENKLDPVKEENEATSEPDQLPPQPKKKPSRSRSKKTKTLIEEPPVQNDDPQLIKQSPRREVPVHVKSASFPFNPLLESDRAIVAMKIRRYLLSKHFPELDELLNKKELLKNLSNFPHEDCVKLHDQIKLIVASDLNGEQLGMAIKMVMQTAETILCRYSPHFKGTTVNCFSDKKFTRTLEEIKIERLSLSYTPPEQRIIMAVGSVGLQTMASSKIAAGFSVTKQEEQQQQVPIPIVTPVQEPLKMMEPAVVPPTPNPSPEPQNKSRYNPKLLPPRLTAD
jgi:hypothetical protein